MANKNKRRLIVVPAVVATLVATVFLLNLTLGNEPLERRLEHRYSVGDAEFVRSMGVLLGPALVEGNRVEVLLNGDEIFPAMLAAIRSAESSINFETYIYWSGRIGREFADALSERARAGVEVRVLVDWVGGEKLEESFFAELESAGVKVRRYNRPHWWNVGRLNHRTHRKLLVVDGKVGFTGGVGIADLWLGDAEDPDHWRDNHYRVTGPAAGQLQAAFADNWLQASGEVLHGERYFPALDAVGPHFANVFASSPDGGSDSMELMYLLAIAAASESIQLSMAYFVPDDVALRMLVEARKRGVKVQMIMPGRITDSDIVRNASRGRWGPLLAAGAEIYEYRPTMYHCKVMIVDGLWVSVGSTNFDSRSFSMNDEANLNVYDAEFARRQVAIFEDDVKQARRITFAEWRQRPWHEKAKEWGAGLLGSQL